MNTIETLIAETQEKLKEWDAGKAEGELPKYYQERVLFCELQLQAYQELKTLGFDIKLKEKETDFCDNQIILNDVLVVSISEYQNKGKYSFRVNYKSIAGSSSLESEQKEPNKISIGKATKKKIEAWIEYAKEIIKEAEEVKEQIDIRKAESLAKIERLSNLPNIKFQDYSRDRDKSKGYIATENFYMSYEICSRGYLRTELKVYYGTKYPCEDLFERLALAGL